jgi:hypothetical protein
MRKEGNLKSIQKPQVRELSRYYAQKHQQNCAFMNSAPEIKPQRCWDVTLCNLLKVGGNEKQWGSERS